jgi:hypothetical protein
MPRIPTTPSVRTFTETWSNDFKDAVTRAAGKNGKLSAAEVKKLAASTGPDKMFADTAAQLLKAAGNHAQPIETIVASARAYAQRAAEAAAGPDKKISLADGAKLPKDLVEDFFLLRGRAAPSTTPVTPAPAAGLPMAELKTKVEAAVNGLWLTSESDAKLKFLTGTQLNGAAITPAIVRSQLGAQHDAVMGDVMYGMTPLASRSETEVRSASAFLTQLATPMDPADPDSVASAAKFAELKKLLQDNLTDLQVIRFGTINISTFIVGRTASGELAGVLSGQVET